MYVIYLYVGSELVARIAAVNSCFTTLGLTEQYNMSQRLFFFEKFHYIKSTRYNNRFELPTYKKLYFVTFCLKKLSNLAYKIIKLRVELLMMLTKLGINSYFAKTTLQLDCSISYHSINKSYAKCNICIRQCKLYSHDEKCMYQGTNQGKINAASFHLSFNGKKIASSAAGAAVWSFNINYTFHTFFPLITSKKVNFIVKKNVNAFQKRRTENTPQIEWVFPGTAQVSKQVGKEETTHPKICLTILNFRNLIFFFVIFMSSAHQRKISTALSR